MFWFASAKFNVPRKPSFKHKALLANSHDSSCHEPPRLLNFNGGLQWMAAYSNLELGARGPAALASNMEVVRKVLRAQEGTCLSAAKTLPSVIVRACNATFLLQRHQRFVDELWAMARDQKLLVWTTDISDEGRFVQRLGTEA